MLERNLVRGWPESRVSAGHLFLDRQTLFNPGIPNSKDHRRLEFRAALHTHEVLRAVKKSGQIPIRQLGRGKLSGGYKGSRLKLPFPRRTHGLRYSGAGLPVDTEPCSEKTGALIPQSIFIVYS